MKQSTYLMHTAENIAVFRCLLNVSFSSTVLMLPGTLFQLMGPCSLSIWLCSCCGNVEDIWIQWWAQWSCWSIQIQQLWQIFWMVCTNCRSVCHLHIFDEKLDNVVLHLIEAVCKNKKYWSKNWSLWYTLTKRSWSRVFSMNNNSLCSIL